ncbi:hypothetical protein LJC68_04095 [Bacteroidales bacterium OttesenSCG-928-B11]|nr:hypothetical protein [Bacteroidales bacterium OttesenSCG-928-C03]MDL2312040.1 hypothetical protein [Bacteroidales bacterium OttesenSCG-928-B11]MDL2326976.1 hypothetical protein [Bacteroidales bacterium OttesenSCG-928-A14]
MTRHIRQNFLDDLKNGELKLLLECVQNDDTLDLELRGDSVVIYYRGGKLLTVKEKGYELEKLDKNYITGGASIFDPTIKNIAEYFPKAKYIVDFYIRNVRNHLWEKEIQQRVVQENNYSSHSKSTDYYIIDTEYQENEIGRFDIVALRWDSDRTSRKLQKEYKPQITVFEVKQGCKSVSGESGMSAHLEDFKRFISDTAKVNAFKQDMINVFRQKRELGLIDCQNPHDISVIEDDIEFVFLLANYDPDSSSLKNELEKISDCKFIYANPMGYVLNARNVIDKAEFVKRNF